MMCYQHQAIAVASLCAEPGEPTPVLSQGKDTDMKINLDCLDQGALLY